MAPLPAAQKVPAMLVSVVWAIVLAYPTFTPNDCITSEKCKVSWS